MVYLHLILRTTLIYFYLIAVVRLMGKREIGQLSPVDLVVAILIAELAAISLELENQLFMSLVPIALIATFELAVSFASVKSRAVRKLMNGEPAVVIQNGVLDRDALLRNRYSVSDILAQLREKDVFNLTDVECAILEPSGRLSILKKSQRRPVTPEDLQVDTGYEGLALPLVCDGAFCDDNLKATGLDRSFITTKLRELGIKGVGEVLLALLETDGNLYITTGKPKGSSDPKDPESLGVEQSVDP